MKEFKFDAVKHVYTLDGKPMYGVTNVLRIINKPALVQWAANCARDYSTEEIKKQVKEGLDLAGTDFDAVFEKSRFAHRDIAKTSATRGKNVHKALEAFIADGTTPHLTEEEQKYYDAGLEWLRGKRILDSEKRMYSETMWVAGTADLVYEVDGKKFVGDFKTSSGIYDLTPFMQCAAYRMMLEEMGEKDFAGSCIIHLKKDGTYDEYIRYAFEDDKEAFLAALTLFKKMKTWKR